jgi:hypothetical protein
MNIAEILRRLADTVEANSAPAQQPVVININNGQPETTALQEPVDPEAPSQADGVMIPPLQAKLELVKKMAGEESVYDPEPETCGDCGCDPCECGVEDEMAIMRRNAGIASPFTALVTDEDEPWEG